jgi:hypothetical protein
MERFNLLTVASAILFLIYIYTFHISNFPIAILIGVGMTLIDYLWSQSSTWGLGFGYTSLGLGLVIWFIANIVSNNFGVTFQELDHFNSLPRVLKHMPSMAITFITMGWITVIKHIIRKS